jgi:predicted metal-dependent HD superfamily phosphohydrolase
MTASEEVTRVWRDIAHRHECDAAAADTVLAELLRAYSEPHRHYHTLEHIAELLQCLEEHGGASDRDAVSLAILFHDVMYDPASRDNEEESAELAAERLTALGFPAPLVAKVDRYVRATRHSLPPRQHDDRDLNLLLDLDLSILAAPPDRYAAYVRAIREEYRAVPQDIFAAGRRLMLESFLARKHIYLTEQFGALFEAPARANLAAELAELG